MKKNLLTSLLVLGCTFVMAACGSKSNSSSSSSGSEEQPTTAYTVAGVFCSNDGENAVDWKYTEQGAMEESSVDAVKELDATVGAALEAREDVLEVYVYEGALIGCTEVGYANWTAKALVDGSVVEFDGGYCVKAIQCDYDEEDGKWLSSQWIPDPHTACVENLSSSTLFVPTWTEAADENGFSWSDNTVCIGGAGEYTIVVAVYDVSVDETNPTQYNYGMALIKTESKEEYKPEAITEHTFGIIGSMNSWASDVAQLSKESDGVYSVTYEFAAGDTWKVRADGAWAKSWGYSDISSPETANYAAEEGNIKISVAGSYKVTLTVVIDEEYNITSGSLAVAKQ